ncbi:hypothetical protein [Candidatus Albibeggiatoa sp. nov. NOAA]|uniref:hypothetical protein n=1 Tax=Candidatus Albibeggiatoa sp. nov. NOAA TaxID=3162724 RepID=UPI0032FD9D83|nr:hypothetical protein [Thiotrichaceae bacterium]
MKLKIEELTTERKWRSATGMDKTRFNKLLALFINSYKEIHNKSIEEKQAAEKRLEFVIKTEEELLYFTLFSLKAGLTYDLLGIVSGMNASNAKKNQEMGLKVLAHALDGYIPARQIGSKEEFEQLFKGIEELLVDATEQPMQRPKDKYRQKAHYSGKKNVIRSRL